MWLPFSYLPNFIYTRNADSKSKRNPTKAKTSIYRDFGKQLRCKGNRIRWD